MNILFLINHAGQGGTEKYVQILCEHLIKDNENNIYFIYNEHGLLADKIKSLGIVTDQVNMKGPFDKKAVKYITDFCQVNKIEIIHTQFQRENYLALQVKNRLKDIKIVYTSHIISKDSFLRKILNKYMTKNDDAIISVCEKNKTILIENYYPEDKIKIIFNGVPYKKYVHNIKNSTIRNEFSIPIDQFVFVTTARFTPEKGIMFLLESVKFLSTLYEEPFKLLLVGDGDEYEQLKKYVDDMALHDKIIFTGYREDIDNILMGSDCFINSSQNEALSFAILEALSKALPVIATKVGGNVDIINEENDCGILVRYGSTISLAKAMEKMMVDEKFYDKASLNAVKTIEHKFDIKKICEETCNLYNILKEKY